jgi:hypothetical protein
LNSPYPHRQALERSGLHSFLGIFSFKGPRSGGGSYTDFEEGTAAVFQVRRAITSHGGGGECYNHSGACKLHVGENDKESRSDYLRCYWKGGSEMGSADG